MGTSFGQYIKKQRTHLGLSLRKVKEAVENEGGAISVSYLNDIEQNRRKPPSGKIVVLLAKVLQLDLQELLNRAKKVDPIVEDVIQEAEVGVLFRMIAEKVKANPNYADQLKKHIDGESGNKS